SGLCSFAWARPVCTHIGMRRRSGTAGGIKICRSIELALRLRCATLSANGGLRSPRACRGAIDLHLFTPGRRPRLALLLALIGFLGSVFPFIGFLGVVAILL